MNLADSCLLQSFKASSAYEHPDTSCGQHLVLSQHGITLFLLTQKLRHAQGARRLLVEVKQHMGCQPYSMCLSGCIVGNAPRWLLHLVPLLQRVVL